MGILADINVLKKYDDQFLHARSSVSETHSRRECDYLKRKYRLDEYDCFILIRKCICEKYENIDGKYEPCTKFKPKDLLQSGLEIHIDPEKRCEYSRKRLPDGSLKLDKICYCSDTREKIRYRILYCFDSIVNVTVLQHNSKTEL